jgi:hypothetical protein
MGKGLNLTVKNETNENVETSIPESRCMSNLHSFNNLIIAKKDSKGYYLETIASKGCAFSNSSFTLKIRRKSDNIELASIYVNSGISRKYDSKVKFTADKYSVDVYRDNSKNQATMTMTLRHQV